jgi:hypothetical protein
MSLDTRNIRCRACKTPITYDRVTSIRATNAEYPLCRFIVCSKECAKAVKNGEKG